MRLYTFCVVCLLVGLTGMLTAVALLALKAGGL